MLRQHAIDIRVRYQETDGQGHVHHANYFTYFEQARTELLRAAGYAYRELESQGIMLVVAEINCRYFLPAHYDDVLQVRVRTMLCKGARIAHVYHVYRGDQLLAEGESVVACINRQGRVQRLPDFLQIKDDEPAPSSESP